MIAAGKTSRQKEYRPFSKRNLRLAARATAKLT